MNARQLTALITLVPFAMGAPARAQVQITFSDTRNWLQSGPRAVEYRGGETSLSLQDGSWTLARCVGTGLVPAGPDCPLGSTAFVTLGDLDGDGQSDQGTFQPLASPPVSAAQIAPFRAQDLFLQSLDDGPKPLEGMQAADTTVEIWHNVLRDQPASRYIITRYRLTRSFGPGEANLQLHQQMVPEGNYTFRFPSLSDESATTDLPFTRRPVLPVYSRMGDAPKGWVITGGNWKTVKDSNPPRMALHWDSRLPLEIRWEGIPTEFTQRGNELSFSLRADRWQDQGWRVSLQGCPPDATDCEVDAYLFPFYSQATPPEERLPHALAPTQSSFLLTPKYYRAGDSARGELRWSHAGNPHHLRIDRSEQVLQFHFQFVDTYEGYAQDVGVFPPSATVDDRSPDYDFDQDGMTNLLEYTLGANAGNPNDTATYQFARNSETGECFASVQKPPFLDDVRYQFEYSTNLVNWTTIVPGDPLFEITQDDEVAYAVSNTSQVREDPPRFPEPSCFLRLRVTRTTE